ncbi:uncharacterized protein P174DRAFT_406521 [Aspergillus novofumigatus IBT 16806]|uniref:Zn(2)-C6 fungal-type domain-containing protein n=1 Tax=Aspergillus novofumigatus (strain IBT 16806) TaxID=1392255 RepID=A0A2I1C929_ASPN1|nr:uncharacterized protein P174DRAFT_406521 [Aspergillus novofumigatus IBT 16806]PKX94124.1 hypothetical protein P174DRAFT_406521 [Aspergillus novofumigatus IBT 16806]
MSVSPSAHLRLRDNSIIRPLRSKRGCKTCKVRRVKCGEEKPRCLRCASTGRKCEYESTISSTFFSSASAISILDNSISLSSNTVWRERRAFAYYFQYAAASIGGGLDVDFWRTIVPQVCRSEPAVWDAMIAISSLFESPDPGQNLVSLGRDRSRRLSQKQRDALEWYSRSVAAVRRGIERGTVDTFVGLITCILFICIEALLGEMEEALRLYGQGVQLILACRAMTATKTSILKDTIIPTFVRVGAVTLSAGVLVSNLLRVTELASTHDFVSLKSAREAIVNLAIEIPLFESACEEYLIKSHACCISQEMMDQRRTLSARLRSWHSAFTNLMESCPTKDPSQVSTGALLRSYHEMLFVMLGVCISPSRITTDDYRPNFQTIVDQSSIALSGSARHDGTQPPFTFELSVGLPLWFTCVRCREPTIRRTALALLRQSHQVEGLYKRDIGATMGERIMMLEETYGTAMNAVQSLVSMDFKPGASPYPTLADEKTGTPAVLVPGEARIKPLGVFRPRDGYPPGTTLEDMAKLSRNRNQTFLHFSRNERDPSNNTWRTIYGYAPIDFKTA